ncbi:MAG TPA: hypothetical protein VMR43_14120 [Variovorax sp.]|nr:hypothetical protein [Variovorax sp.]
MKQDPTSSSAFRYVPTEKDRIDLLTQVIHRTNVQYRSADVPTLAQPLELIRLDNTQHPTIHAGEVKPGEAPRIYEISEGYVVSHAHAFVLHDFNGSVTHLHFDGLIETTKPCLRRIDICDLREVAEHRVHRLPHTDVPNITSHVIHFMGGGFFSFLMDESGTILETIQRRVAAEIDRASGVMTLHGSRMPDHLAGQP